VSAEAGAPYVAQLLPLPEFLRTASALASSPAAVASGLRLTGFFLERHIMTPRGLHLPDTRAAILQRLQRAPVQ